MSKTSKLFVWVIALVIVLGGAWWYLSQNTTPQQGTQSNPQSSGVSYPTTSSDNSNTALNQDLSSIDSQLNALNSDSASIDTGLNDQPIQQGQ